MTRRLTAAALLSLAIAWPGAARAMLVTWELEGTIESASPYTVPHPFPEVHADELIPQLEAAGLAVGAAWRARLTFDAGAVAAPSEESWADFPGATQSLEFLAGSFAASSPGGVTGGALSFAYSDPALGGSELYFTIAVETGSPSLFVNSAALVLVSLDPDALYATTPPSEPPDVSALVGPTVGSNGSYLGSRLHLLGHGFVRNSDLAIFYGGPPLVSQSFAIDGRITSITAVPESSLFALGLVAAAAIAIRRRSRALP